MPTKFIVWLGGQKIFIAVVNDQHNFRKFSEGDNE